MVIICIDWTYPVAVSTDISREFEFSFLWVHCYETACSLCCV